jgi:crotonobetainyl-CoA:carnitine CoA-transferase CaiB-like acyl-CoA transferase
MQSAAAMLGPKVVETAFLGHPPQAINPPAGSYATADGWIAVTLVREAQYRALVATIGAPELADDPRFDSFANRTRHLAPLLQAVAARFAARPTAEWVGLLNAAGVLASPINDFADWLAEPQVQACGAAPLTEVAPGASLPVPRTPGGADSARPSPALGAHTAAVLREFGLD